MKTARNPDMVIAAEALFSSYQEYMEAGFTPEQSFDLVKVGLSSSIIGQTQNDRHR